MAGTLDLHMVHALQQGWAAYFADNGPAFQALFAGTPDATTAAWWAALKPDVQAKTFHIFGKPGVEGDKKPWPDVPVELTGENVAESYLGEGNDVADDGTERLVMDVEQQVRVAIWTNSPELTRALHVLIRAILFEAERHFMQAGYHWLRYGGVEPLTFEQETVAEAMGAFVVHMRYSARSPVRVKRLTAAPTVKSWFVLAADQKTLDGKAGGVVPFDG